MPSTDLIVAVQVHALIVNDPVRRQEVFQRWTLNFDAMLGEDKQAAEPPPGHTDDFGDGVYVQWQLPESLASGHYDPDTEETTFPLVPNRWLVVRHYTVPGGFPGEGQRRAAAWLVHSDYLELAHGGEHWGTVQFPSPDPDSDTGELRVDFLGRVHDLREGPWTEPEPIQPFLTAVGPGVLGFGAFQPYQQNVFSFHDDLSDLVGHGHNQPATTTLGYLVVGWYSADDIDILNKAADIPGLIPPDTPGLAGVLAGLGWHLPGLTDDTDVAADPPIPAPQRSVYAGTALGIPWEYYAADAPPGRPGHDSMKVAFGHSTADALEALGAHQTRSARTGELLSALYSGTIDRLDEGDGDVDFDEVTQHAWFSSRAGGYTWLVVPRGTDGPQPARAAPAQPVWLDELNADQAEFEAHTLELDHLQERLRTLWWMKDLPNRPAGFTEAAERQLDASVPATLAHRAMTAAAQMRRILEEKKLPHAITPEELEPQIARYAADRGLPATLELRRAARESYYSTTDPAMVIAGGGVNQPLTRAPDDPLPCRLESTLVETIVINGTPVAAPQPPLGLIQAVPARAIREAARPPVTLTGQSAPLDLSGLAGPVAALLREFTLLDLASTTPADDGSGRSALAVALANPGLVTGTLAEYTAVWKQPWLPMYVQWDLRYHAVPYMSDGRANWAFKDDAYEWLGTGADPGDGYTGPTWLPFAGRAFVTPAAPYIVASQIDRLLETYSADDAGALRALRADYDKLDLLSQTLDGFNDHLLMRDTGVRARIPEHIARLTGDVGHVADPGAPGDDSRSRFQPVRAGQFYFRDLRIIDRFGRCAVITSVPGDRFKQFRPVPAASVRPTRELADDIENPARFIQLPPRLLHEARVRLELARGQDGTALLAGRAAPAGPDSPLTGWLLVNHLDDNLLIYGPDGDPVGELRIVRGAAGTRAVAFTPLPGSPYRREDDPAFAQQHPHLAPFVRKLVGPPGRYEALLTTIDQTLETIVDPSAEDDRTPARLVGRPVVLYRTRLALQLRGQPLTNPGWAQALNPDQQEYPAYTWPIRLGEPDQLSDGLIGYYASATGPGGETDYTRLHVAAPATGDPYLVEIGNGEDLALPARPPGQEVIHELTILADPHVPVHATTDILPVTELRLPGDLAHQALRRIRAAFRLNPLLAPVRLPPPPQQENRSEGNPEEQEHLVVVQPAAHHGTWTWAQPYTDPGDGGLSWMELPLLATDAAAHPGDPVPHARAGYLLLHPAVPDIPEQP